MRTITIPITTAADGSATATRTISGQVLKVGVDVGSGATELADTVDVTVTDDTTGSAIASIANVTADSVRYPAVVQTQPDGTALTTLGPGIAPVVQGRLKVVVAQGGDTKSGSVLVTIA